jgi:subtilase family serine protease
MTKTGFYGVLLLFAFGISGLAAAQEADQSPIVRREGTVIIPVSSIERPEDAGIRMHTDTEIFVPAGREMSSITPDDTFAETPASLACVYGVGKAYTGCNPATGTSANLATGGWGAIALVDAYDDPNAESDLAAFSSHYGLPAAKFTKVFANSSFGTLNGRTASCSGTPPPAYVPGGPPTGRDWDIEESVDIEAAHAMAPGAAIILVEACSNLNTDLYYAEEVAGIAVAKAGGGDISNSFGGAEYASEVNDDNVFFRYYWSHISYFASAGDKGWGAGYPSSSPWVVSAGGTTINRDGNQNFVSESCWGNGVDAPNGNGSGGGVSAFEKWQSPPVFGNGMGPWAAYQWSFAGTGPRQTPDMSFDSDLASGMNVYDSDEPGSGPWWIVGGTSLASPALAGIVNASNDRAGQALPIGGHYTSRENSLIYAEYDLHLTYPNYFYDVTTGSNGSGHNAGPNYDQCTGIGSPRGHFGK